MIPIPIDLQEYDRACSVCKRTLFFRIWGILMHCASCGNVASMPILAG